ncbi:MAG: hypothetical protein HY231_09365 [Acidobacteria bacterium]|nr:hypothetical protein [Acidobacteriota bacterium]
MMNCTTIKRLIDEAEHRDVLPFEATNHVNDCASCRHFANERAGLRYLLSDIPRVSAPTYFDAQLKARLAEAKAKPAFAWLNPTLYFRLGTATAALCIAVFALQYSGVISLTNTTASKLTPTTIAPSPMPTTPQQASDTLAIKPLPEVAQPTPTLPPATATVNAPAPSRLIAHAKANRVQPNNSQALDDYAISGMPRVFIRNNRGQEIELPMQPISVGAQSQLLRRAARSSASPVVMQPVSF